MVDLDFLEDFLEDVVPIIITVLILSILCGVVLFFSASCNLAPGDGEKIGQIIKISRTGFVCKTYEVQLIRGGMTSGSGSFGVTPFDFTIRDEDGELLYKAKEALEKQQEVRVFYHTERFFPCSSDTGHFATAIK